MIQNRYILCVIFLISALVVYRVSSGSPLIENWGWTMVPMNTKVDVISNGQSSPMNNQSQLFYNQNQLINTSLLNNEQRTLLSETLNPSLTLSSSQLNTHKRENVKEVTNYNVTENFPVYTVPGTYQADLPQRFNPNGLNSFVKYNIPNEKYLAGDDNSNKSLEYANLVETPKIKEDFTSCSSSKDYNDMNQKLVDQGTEVLSKLPVTPMNQSSGNEKSDVYYNADRYLFALQKSRLYGLADYIRGDIPVVPCNPNRNPYSNTWFRPSVTPRYDLNAGAMGIIAGIGNVSNQQTLELMSRSTGGSNEIINGVSVNPVDTPIYNLENSNYNNMGNQFSQVVDKINPPSTVTTTSFP